MKLSKPLTEDQRGDTLVEVLLAIAAISFTLIIVYNLSNRMLRQVRIAGERGVAVNLLRQQIEGLFALQRQKTWADFADDFATGQTYNLSISNVSDANTSNQAWQINTGDGTSGVYTLRLRRSDDNSNPNSQTFFVEANWERLGGGATDRANMTTLLTSSEGIAP